MMRLIVAVSILCCALVHAEVYVLPLKELKFEKASEKREDLLDKNKSYNSWALKSEPMMSVRTPDGVMIYIAPESKQWEAIGDSLVALELAENKAFSAQLDIYDNSALEVFSFAFSFDPKNHKPAKQEDFEKVKKTHYKMLSMSGYVGTPWFNEMAGDIKFGPDRNNNRINGRETNFSFYTGGRAISDNLALDRELRLMKNDLDTKVDISSVRGIKTKEIDWTDLMPKGSVAVDKLAMLVPEDQHVLICPSLAEMEKIVDLVEKEGSPLAQGFTVRNPFRKLPSRYKEQLGLNFPAAFAKMAPIKSVAVTGYDPFFPTGTDVAVLLESDQPKMLFKMLDGVIKSPDKNIALVGETVVVSNSKSQLARIQDVHAGKVKSLGSLDEYTFFRHRYPIAETGTGFVFLSDACIRRWGGPRLRIAASRRTKSIAALNYLTAKSLSTGNVVELNDDQKFLLGSVSSKEGTLVSDKMGSLHFMTPTIDMDLDKVTKTEADAYSEWRRGYEEGWSKVFDPIGFSFRIDDKTKELDLTVMPLTVNNDYREMIGIVGKSIISREAKIMEDDHVFSATLAIDKDGAMMKNADVAMSGMMPGLKVRPLGWLGNSITLFVEKDARWQLLEHAGSKFDKMMMTAPVGVRVEHSSKIKLASFLLALKTVANQVAPNALRWENKMHGETSYVVVSSNEGIGINEDISLHYVITNKMLIMSLREDVIKREIDRENVESKVQLSRIQENADHFYLKSSSEMLMAFAAFDGASLPEKQRKQSYRAIPILNEWKRRFKDADTVSSHYVRFGEDLFCPGGKGYAWNAEAMTMESVVYGHPAHPKKVEDDGAIKKLFGEIETSMKFEHDGIRIRLKVGADEAKPDTTVLSPGTKLLGVLDLPTQPGLKWEYEVKITEDGKETIEPEVIENISFKDDILVQKYSGSYVEDNQKREYKGEYVYSTKNGLELLSDKYEDGEVTNSKYSPAIKTFPKELRQGFRQMQVCKSEVNVKGEEGFDEWMAVDIKVLGLEDVEIGETVYKDCYKIMVNDASVATDGAFYSGMMTYWVHPKIGVVKYVSKNEFSESVSELKKFTTP